MRVVRFAAIAVVLVAAGYFGWHATRSKPTVAPPPPPTPVSAAEAKQGSVPIDLHTIGTVRALNSADLRPQVGGILIDVPVREGDEVKKDQVLAVIDPRPLQAALDKAKAQLAQDQAQLQNAQLDRQRYATLARSDFASRQQLDTQVATVNRLQGAVAADQADINQAQINLGYSVLRSPFDGRVGIRRVDPGNLVQANQTQAVFTIVEEKPISVLFNIPERDLPSVQDARTAGTVPVMADAPGSESPIDTGTLTTIDNAIDPTSGTIQLRATFPNEKEALTPGQFVDVRVQVGQAQGVVVPHTAVQHAQAGLFVFTLKPDKTVDRVDVQVAYDDGHQAVLKSGLSAGTTVVTEGQTRIGAGSKVAVNGEGDKPQESAAR